MKIRWKLIAILTILTLVIAAGCSKSGQDKEGTGENTPPPSSSTTVPPAEQQPAPKETPPPAPLTLSFLQTSAAMTDDEFVAWVKDPVKKKFPHITMEIVREDTTAKLAEFVVGNSIPDIIYAGPVSARALAELKAVHDLTSMVKENNINLAKFDLSGIEAIHQLSDKGELLALPMGLNFSVLYYNKEIFDKMAVDYPADGMTWDEAVELAKRLTVPIDGIQYKGLAINGNINRLGEQLSLPMVDPKTMKAAFQTDSWKLAFEMYRKIYGIPGNDLEAAQGIPAFTKDRILAMFAGLSARIGEFEQLHREGQPLDWDMVTTPTFTEYPDYVFGNGAFYLMLSETTKHKEEAFGIIQMLTEEESQTRINKSGRRSSLVDRSFVETFGDDLVTMEGKNKDAIFMHKLSPLPPVTIYEDLAFKEVVKAGRQFLANPSKDVNTALREADENLNKAIAASGM